MMKKTIKKIVLLLITVFITIIVLFYSQKSVYRIFDSDFNRHLVIVDALNGVYEEEPKIIVFGDSRAMFGVDSRIIKDAMNYNKEIYNLSSVGQSIYESSYFYTHIGSGTGIVVQCTSPSFFTENIKHSLPERKAISMFLSGYRINSKTKELILNYNQFFDNPDIVNYFKSRSYFQSYIHNLLRPVFDNEIFNEKSRFSKYFPHIYTQDKHPEYPVYKYDCDRYILKELPIEQLSFLSKIKNYFEIRKISYVIVLMPVNPDACNECYDEMRQIASLIESNTGIKVIDLSSHLLNTDLFYDATHANEKGAKIISAEIARQLMEH